MTPLHLLDPDSPDFSPANCTSLHDITRFCHEKAVGLMFDSEAALNRNMGKQLKVGVKLQYWVIDMDDGFKRSVSGPLVELGDIACKPMLALWNGMWPCPGPGAAGDQRLWLHERRVREHHEPGAGKYGAYGHG